MKRLPGLCFAIISAAAAFAQNQPVPPDKGVTIRGNVNKPGVYPFPAHDTVKTFVGEAGGVVERFIDLAYIYRTDNAGISHTIRINLGKILTGGRPDIKLQPGDVVDIPFFPETLPKSRPINSIRHMNTGRDELGKCESVTVSYARVAAQQCGSNSSSC